MSDIRRNGNAIGRQPALTIRTEIQGRGSRGYAGPGRARDRVPSCSKLSKRTGICLKASTREWVGKAGEDIPPGCGLRRPAEGIVSGWEPDTVRNMRVLPVLLAIIACATLHAELLPPPVLERYEQMLVKTPEPGTAFDKVYQHYLESEGLEALAKHWSDAAEKNQAGRADYLLLLGLLDDQRGKTDDALKNLRAAAEGGQSWRAWSALASVEARAGKLAPAVEDYQKAIARNPPRDALVKMYRGLALGQQRLMDFAGAVETWQRCAKASPGDPFVLEEAGDALLEAGCFEEARTMFVKLRDQTDADPERR